MESINPGSILPTLPAEFQLAVIHESIPSSSTYSELALAWTNLRMVSIFFKEEVERLFRRTVLASSTIQFMAGREPRTQLEDQARDNLDLKDLDLRFRRKQVSTATGSRYSNAFRHHSAVFAFSHMHQGTTTAAFSQRSYDDRTQVTEGPREPFPRAFYEMLARRTSALEEREVAHHYTVQVSNIHNDIVIPDMAFKKSGDNMEVHFDWKAHFSKLFSEEMRNVRLRQDKSKTEHSLGVASSTWGWCTPDEQPDKLPDWRPHLRALRLYNWCRRHSDHITKIEWFDDTFDGVDDLISTRVRKIGLEKYHSRFWKKQRLYDEYRRVLWEAEIAQAEGNGELADDAGD